jgi:hypothetical protein
MAVAEAKQVVKLEEVDYSKLWWLTLAAGGLSALVNVLLYFAAQAVGFVGEIVPNFGPDVPPPPVPFAVAIVGASIAFIIVGSVALWVIDRFNAKPISTWRIVAIVALVLSYGQPFVAFSNMNEIILLLVMHTIAGIITIYIISTQAKKA